MNRRREKRERDDRVAEVELIALRAQAHAREALNANTGLRADNAALRQALVKKRIVTEAEIDAEKPAPILPTPLVKP